MVEGRRSSRVQSKIEPLVAALAEHGEQMSDCADSGERTWRLRRSGARRWRRRSAAVMMRPRRLVKSKPAIRRLVASPGPSGCPGPAGSVAEGLAQLRAITSMLGCISRPSTRCPPSSKQAVSAGLGALMLFKSRAGTRTRSVPGHRPQGILSRRSRSPELPPPADWSCRRTVPGRVHRPRTLRRALRS